eukprot:EG_transcript_20982
MAAVAADLRRAMEALGLVELQLRPPGAAPAAPGCAVFVSAALADGATAAPPPAHTVLVLVPGSGSEGTEAVGLWSSLTFYAERGPEEATVLPYVRSARARGWAAVVLNPNHTMAAGGGARRPIKGSETAVAHLNTAWGWLHTLPTVQHVLVAAHSQGGSALMDFLAQQLPDSPLQPTAVALLDSVHRPAKVLCGAAGGPEWVRHWMASAEPLDSLTPKPWLRAADSGCCSAGTPDHGRVPAAALPSVLRFFEERLGPVGPQPPATAD